MTALPASDRSGIGMDEAFQALRQAMAVTPLHEVAPARPGDGPAALGFALAHASGWAGPAGLVLITARTWSGEEGVCSPRGLAALGLDVATVLGVRVRTGQEALWAAEQALDAPCATVVCALSDREVDLTASRRLLLKAEKSGARAMLVRAMRGGESAMASAAHTRWSVAARVSEAPWRLVGPPAWRASLVRRRGGAPGAVFDLEWLSDARAFRSARALAGDLVAASGDGSPAGRAARAA
jgi:protein ImuA